MPSPEKRQIEEVFKPQLKLLGFRKRGGTWHRAIGDVIQVVNLQGSQWSTVFFVNLGIYFTALGTEERPTEYRCHVRTRLSQLVPDIHHLAQLLDLHTKNFDQAGGDELTDLLLRYGIPWLEQCSTREGVRKAATAKHPPIVHVKAKVHFGLI